MIIHIKRNGTANIFVAVDFKGGKRDITVTDRRTKKDFAFYMKHLVNETFSHAKKLRIIMDNLNTHTYSSILETLEFKEAVELISKLEFYPTPKHASWLNIAEIEINVMDQECTGRRIGDKNKLMKLQAGATIGMKKKTKIHWNFTKKKADEKLSKFYI